MSIQRDLTLGGTGEDRVVQLFNEVDIHSHRHISKGPFPDFDICSTIQTTFDGDIHFTSEVKYDIYAIRSGNVAIEVYNPKVGKPSGLMVTKADLWVHITDAVYVANTDALKKWVNDTPAKRIITAGGDDNATFRKIQVLCVNKSVFIDPVIVWIHLKLNKEEFFLAAKRHLCYIDYYLFG